MIAAHVQRYRYNDRTHAITILEPKQKKTCFKTHLKQEYEALTVKKSTKIEIYNKSKPYIHNLNGLTAEKMHFSSASPSNYIRKMSKNKQFITPHI